MVMYRSAPNPVDLWGIWSQIVYAKSSYDRLRIDKALGFRKSNKKKSKNSVRSIGDLFRVH